MSEKTLVKVAVCMPEQRYDRESKLAWLDRALGETDCDLFLTPQEYIGGHYAMKDDLHVEQDWLTKRAGGLAKKYGKHLGIGACVKREGSGAMESYLYYDDRGELRGQHSKFALPAYDDVRAFGHGELWPETSFQKRVTPVELPALRLRVGTCFCWEVFSQALLPAYSMAGINFLAHPIKFAPRGWLQNKKQADGKLHIVGFGHAPNSQIWVDRLLFAGRHQVMCPIGVSCNSWNLGAKFKALTGHVDEMRKTTTLHDVPSVETEQKIHVFEMLPEYYEGLDHHHSAGAFKAHVGSVEGFSEMGEWVMHGKMRRLEAHLLGGTTLMDCMRFAAQSRQKPSTVQRVLSSGVQKVRR